jgi:anaerobic magnesium-protoporphyrin IX monomethyl ester cyclase
MNVVLTRCGGTREGETNVTGCYPPLGLAYLAAALQASGTGVSIIDAEVLGLGHEQLLSQIAPDADLIGFSATTLAWPSTRLAAAHVRSAFPNALLVIGGAQVNAFPEETLLASVFDLGVLGDGEATLVELVARLASGRDVSDLEGCVVRDGDQIRVNEPIPWMEDLDTVPFPALDLLPMDRYQCVMVEEPFVSMITSRGCPYRCDFCSQIYCGSTLRSRSAESIVDEMQHWIERYGAKEIVLFDETFGVKKQIALRVCELIQERGIKIRWNARTRINLVDRELLSAMRNAGCYALHLGIESGTDRVLALMNKKITTREVRAAVALARELGFQTHAYFMLGYPGETRAEIAETLRFSRSLRLDWASYTITIPSPRTPLCERAVEMGALRADYWREYTFGREPVDCLFFESDECSVAYLHRTKRRAYIRFYMRPGVLARNLLFFVRRGGFRRVFYAMCLWFREGLR